MISAYLDVLYDGKRRGSVCFQVLLTKTMSLKTTAGIGALVAVVCAAGAVYWLHQRAGQPLPDVVTAEPPGFRAAAPESVLTSSQPKKLAADGANSKKSAPAPPAPVDAGLRLKPGEILDYTANVSKLTNVATLSLKTAGKGNFLGKSTWHLQASAHTLNPLRMVFELDDQFDSYSDSRTLACLQYEMHLNEKGQKVESVQRMSATGKEPAPADATAARVLPGTRDPLGMMGYLRTVDWKATPQVSSPVYDGHKLYDVRARLAAGSVGVIVPAGNFTTSKIQIRVFEDGAELKDASFTLYLANDLSRTPALLEAIMPFATARVELAKVK